MPRAHAAAPRLIISYKVSLLAALVILMATAGLLATSTATLTNTLRRYDYYTNGDHHFYHSKHTVRRLPIYLFDGVGRYLMEIHD
nr:unnamed protein product [Callosobruchus chinensis]